MVLVKILPVSELISEVSLGTLKKSTVTKAIMPMAIIAIIMPIIIFTNLLKFAKI
ncbi:hypothetical protein NsoK4_08835 [Nitrosopumilus sp. K4]|uniref:hypothetical protein n=1 Tax=Nitrosopumilus sp. K4 TaxID=2795383 RepID=UPI001BA59299|nr:hypothetical protein [Nitrosopumilus sp. K4]QUC64512.1 hypothetical protein NsoK4_08835 [Nitrosopumilus sp. K4]